MDNYNDYEEQPKKFVITRGMVLIFAIILIVVIVLIVVLTSKKKDKDELTKDQYLYLEKRMEEETPTTLERLNLDINLEPQKIDLEEFLDENGGPIVASKVPAAKLCEGYVIAQMKDDISDINAYIKCGKYYITKGYETTKDEPEEITTTTAEQEKDSENPVITLNGEETIRITVGTAFKDPGVKATDNVDGDITSKVVITGKVNEKVPATYILIYTIKDSSGNTAKVSRKVIVEEQASTTTTKSTTKTTTKKTTTKYTTRYTTKKTTKKTTTTAKKVAAPTIILSGSSTVTITQGSNYKEPGYSARDAYGANLTSKVKVTSNVNTYKAGSYTIKYTVTDSYGNTSSKSRTVIVKSSGTPVSSIKVTPNAATIKKNKTLKLTVTKSPSDATNNGYTYSSSNSNIASVNSSGVVTGKNVGTATITVKSSNGKTATCTVTVTN